MMAKSQFVPSHSDEHTDNIRSFLCNVDEIATRSVGKFDSIDHALWSNNIGNMRDTCSARSTEIKYLGTRLDVNVIETPENSCGKLGTERIPYSIFYLCIVWSFNAHTLFTIY